MAAFTNWDPDPNPTQPNVTLVHHNHIRQLRTKLEEALNALHLPVGSYEHPTLTENSSPIYAVDFQELRNKIKDAWTALASTSSLTQAYDGDGLRVKKTEYGWSTFYLRSGVLGGQVIADDLAPRICPPHRTTHETTVMQVSDNNRFVFVLRIIRIYDSILTGV